MSETDKKATADRDDERLSALYHQAAAPAPDARLDSEILAAAHRAVASRPRGLAPFSGRRHLPFAIAVVLLLSVSLVPLMEDEVAQRPQAVLDAPSGALAPAPMPALTPAPPDPSKADSTDKSLDRIQSLAPAREAKRLRQQAVDAASRKRAPAALGRMKQKVEKRSPRKESAKVQFYAPARSVPAPAAAPAAVPAVVPVEGDAVSSEPESNSAQVPAKRRPAVPRAPAPLSARPRETASEQVQPGAVAETLADEPAPVLAEQMRVEAESMPSADAWLAEIRHLLETGQVEQARAAWLEFRRSHPLWPVDDELRELLELAP